MKIIKIYFVATAAVLIISACSDGGEPVDPEGSRPKNGFETEEVAAVFADNCSVIGCHAGSAPANGLSLEDHSGLFRGSSMRPLKSGGTYGGEAVIPFNSGKSLLFQMIKGNTSMNMPPNGTPLSNAEIETIRRWIDEGAKDENGNIPLNNPPFRVYVCNQASDLISVIDGDAENVSRIIDVSSTPNIDAPHMVKFKDGFLYATLISAGKLLKIGINDYRIIGEVSGLDYPGMIMITEDGTKAYVSRSSSAPGSYSSIYVIDTQNMTLIKEILLPVSGIPHGIVLSPDNSRLYAANLTKNRISLVNTSTDEFAEDILLSTTEDHEPMQTNISPDGSYLYISARATGKLLILDILAKNVISEVMVGMMPMHIAVSSTGDKIYVPSMMGNFVAIVEKSGLSWSKTGEISHPAFSMLHGADLTSEDKYLFVSSRNLNGNFEPAYKVTGEGLISNVGIINTETRQVEKILEIEEYGAGITVGK